MSERSERTLRLAGSRGTTEAPAIPRQEQNNELLWVLAGAEIAQPGFPELEFTQEDCRLLTKGQEGPLGAGGFPA